MNTSTKRTEKANKMTKTEFNKAVRLYGLRDAIYYAKLFGVAMAQVQLWVRGLK
jgi:hypothetical protein